MKREQNSQNLPQWVGGLRAMDDIMQNLAEISRIIADTVPVETIYLFGSYAYGTPNKDSDVDLYVVFKDEMPMRELEAINAINTAIYPVKNMPMDILGLKQNRFHILKMYATLERKIAREGIKLYGYKYKAEILQQLLDKANDNLRAAEHLSTMQHPTPDETICYLCQQSAEKYLKAVVFIQDIEPEKNHTLEVLLNICQGYNASFSTLLAKINFLKKYAVTPRYPNNLEITNADMKTAIQYAKDVQEFVLKAIEGAAKSE